MSRNTCDLTKTKFRQASSSAITSRTTRAKDYARLYFRPDTNTQWVCQGIKSVEELERDDAGAHCPLMVMMLFDSRDVLTLEETRFTDRSLAYDSANILSTADEFLSLPFQDIYSSGPLPSIRKDEIKARRQSEVLYPDRLSLDSLVAVHCRTVSDRATLVNLCGGNTFGLVSKIKGDDSGVSMWTQRRLFLESVYADSTGLVVSCDGGRATDSYEFDIAVRALHAREGSDETTHISITGAKLAIQSADRKLC